MQELRTVHFRYPPCFEPLKNDPKKDPAKVSFKFQCFANGFFSYMKLHGICPNLTALVVGCYWEDKGILKNPRNQHHPRHFLVKGYQTDALEPNTTIGVPVPAWLLRQNQPVSDILDCNHERKRIGDQA